MDRRRFVRFAGASCAGLLGLAGCRSKPVGEVITDGKKDMVGNTAAGAETYKPLIDEALGKLLARQAGGLQPASVPPPAPKRVCVVGMQNKSSDEQGDYRDQLVEELDTRVNQSKAFVTISRQFTGAGLREARVRPDELFVPAKQREFLRVMEQQGTPFEYLLFMTFTSGTTRSGDATQKDYTLTLELVDVHAGTSDKESASLRKAYRKSRLP